MNNDQHNVIEGVDRLPGEEGIPSVNDARRTSPKRVAGALFVFFVLAVAAALLYRHHIQAKAQEAAQSPDKKQIQQSAFNSRKFVAGKPVQQDDVAAGLAGDGAKNAPPPPPPLSSTPAQQGATQARYGGAREATPPPPPVFSRAPIGEAVMVHEDAGSLTGDAGGLVSALTAGKAGGGDTGAGGAATSALASILTSTPRDPRQASVLKDADFTVPRGFNIDCVLMTRIDSTTPGMTSCITTQDVYGATGKVLLLPRGSAVDGEYQGNIRQGQQRIAVMWARIRTADNIVVDIDSLGTDPLGGAGVPGYVDNHWGERVGGALLLSVIEDGVQGLSNKLSNEGNSSGGTTISMGNTTDATQTLASEMLRNTINIPPTLYKNQGERVAIFVARDLDLRNVYDLRAQ